MNLVIKLPKLDEPVSSKRYKLAYVPIKDSDDISLHFRAVWSVFDWGSMDSQGSNIFQVKSKALISLCECADQFESSLIALSAGYCSNLCNIGCLKWLSNLCNMFRHKTFLCKIVNIFLPIIFSICFVCSKEPSRWDGSFEYPQHMFWLRKKIIFCCSALLTQNINEEKENFNHCQLNTLASPLE